MIIYIVYRYYWNIEERKIDTIWRTLKQAQEHVNKQNNQITKYSRHYGLFIESANLED